MAAKEEPVSRMGRRLFAWILVAFSLGTSVYMALTGVEGSLAEIVVEGLIGVAQVGTIFYISGSVVDRSNILGKLGDRGGGSVG